MDAAFNVLVRVAFIVTLQLHYYLMSDVRATRFKAPGRLVRGDVRGIKMTGELTAHGAADVIEIPFLTGIVSRQIG